MHSVWRVWGAALLLLGSALSAGAQAQEFPNRPVALVIPYPTGGPVDLVGRMLSERLTARLGQPVVVENRGGAGGTIGTQRVAKAPADGHVLLLTAQTPVTIAPLFKPAPPYDARTELLPIARVVSTPVLVLGPGDGPDKDLAALVARAKGSGMDLNYGAPGIGNEMHLIWETLRMSAGIKSTAIPYQGTGPGLIDLTAGRIDVMVTAPASVRNLLADGKLRALAVVSDRRLEELPDVPTVGESGVQLPTIPIPWLGLFAPGGTPAAVAERIYQAVLAVSEEPSYRERMRKFGMDPAVKGLGEFTAEVDLYSKEWSRVVSEGGIDGSQIGR
ncbi:MAG: tripartite tricarboxylate transporter substrate binding protein [Burkholderiaceae bacterium]|nr:tripartite tricarboxylate transporter substrate binding protein [Burkholderiaceae bacterium]